MSLRRCTVSDLMGLPSQRMITDEGFLVAPGIIATSGNVQSYTAGELGLDGMDPRAVLGLYRPPSEVLDPACVSSFESKTITNDHPPDGVSIDNWDSVSVGDVNGACADGQHIKGTLVIRNKAARDAVLSGKSALSCGYSFDLEMTPGKSPGGAEYHGIQTNIRGNHVAIVDSARGGPQCRIADNQKGDTRMAKKIVVDGIPIEVDEVTESVVTRLQASVAKSIGDAEAGVKLATEATAKAKTATDALESAKVEHAAKIAELTAKIPTDAAIEAMVEERATVVGDAALIVPEIKTAGKSLNAIRSEVIAHAIFAGDESAKAIASAILRDTDVDKASPEKIVDTFAAIVAQAKSKPASASDSLGADFVRSGDGEKRANDSAPELTGRDAYIARLNRGEHKPATKN